MYRDEGEALRARVATLQAELGEARQRRRDLEARAADARQARQAALRTPAEREGARQRYIALGLGLALCAVGGIGSQVLQSRFAAAEAERAELTLLSERAQKAQARVSEIRRELASARERCTPAQEPAPPPAAPFGALGRAEIQAGMGAIKTTVQACYDQHRVPGTAFVTIRIEGSGEVSSAKVKGIFRDTPTGACLERAARSARFRAYRGDAITVDYPFILR